MSRKVLVIEDNPNNLRLISYALRRAGYKVVGASTGEEGITLAISEKFCFIIMDIQLPGIDGLETTRRIRASKSGGIPIIAMTSYAMRGDREKLLAAGCNAYFEKPIDPLTIIDRIHAVIEKEKTP